MSGTADTFRHAAIYSAANMLGKMAAFIMLPLYAHALGTEGYGVIGMVDASIALLTSVLAYGCQNAIIRIYHEQSEPRKLLAISTGYWVTFCATLGVTALVVAGSGGLSVLLFGDAALQGMLCMALVAFFLDMNTQAAATVLLIHRKSAQYSLLGIMRLLSGLSMNVIFIVMCDWGVFGYFLSSVLTSLLHFVVMQHLCFTRVGTAFDLAVARQIVDFQWPLIPGALVSFAARQSERVSLRFFESLEKVGVLEMAYKFPALITMLIHEPFMNAWNTERLRLAQTGTAEASRKIGEMFTLALFLLVLVALLIALSIRDVLVLLTPPAFWEATRIAQIECVTLVLAAATQHVNLGFVHRKDTRAWARTTSIISVTKIVVSVAFVASMGLWGAAYSALLAASVLFFLALQGGQRRYHVQHRHPWNLVIVGAALALFFLAELMADVLLDCSTSYATLLLSQLREMFVLPGDAGALTEKMSYLIDLVWRILLGALLLVLLPFIRYQKHPASAVIVANLS